MRFDLLFWSVCKNIGGFYNVYYRYYYSYDWNDIYCHWQMTHKHTDHVWDGTSGMDEESDLSHQTE